MNLLNQYTVDAFFDEIEKVAAKAKPRKLTPEEMDQHRVNRGIMAGAGTVGAQMAFGHAAMPFMKDKNPQLPEVPPTNTPSPTAPSPEHPKTNFLKEMVKNEHGDIGDARQIARADKVREQMGINRGDLNYHIESGMGPAVNPYAQPKPVVHLPNNTTESVIAHELGHVKNDKMVGRFGRGLGTVSRVGSRFGMLPAAVYAGAADDPSYTPALMQAGVSAPMLADEALASGRAVKHMVKQHGLWKGLKRSAVLAPAFATYGVAAGAPLAITAGRKYFKNKESGKGGIL